MAVSNERYMQQLEQTQILPMAKCTSEQQILHSNKAMEEQSTHFICITYQQKHNGSVLLANEWCTEQSTHFTSIICPEKHNGTVLLTYEARTKQLVSPSSNFGPDNPRRPKG